MIIELISSGNIMVDYQKRKLVRKLSCGYNNKVECKFSCTIERKLPFILAQLQTKAMFTVQQNSIYKALRKKDSIIALTVSLQNTKSETIKFRSLHFVIQTYAMSNCISTAVKQGKLEKNQYQISYSLIFILQIIQNW